MLQKHLHLLACPECGKRLAVSICSSTSTDGSRVLAGELACQGGHTFPIVDGVPRFVPSENYAENFGYQWIKFSKTLLDSYSGHQIFRERFFRQSGWRADELAGRSVLEVGCGAGPFTEVVLSAGAEVISLDYSVAVNACFKNNGHSPNLTVVQGDIYHLPLAQTQFDFVFCFGVLQHTPDVKAAFMSLPAHIRPGGRLAVDVYRKHWSNVLHSKYWLRPFTSAMPNRKLFKLVEKWVPRLMPLSNAVSSLPGGRYLRRMIPVANYRKIFPLTESQLLEWAILDTFDWLGPKYDQPQTAATLVKWFRECGMSEVEVVHPAHLAVRGKKVK